MGSPFLVLQSELLSKNVAPSCDTGATRQKTSPELYGDWYLLPRKLAAIRLGRRRNLDRELLAQSAESRFQLVEPRSMAKIEQPVHLWQVAVQPPS